LSFEIFCPLKKFFKMTFYAGCWWLMPVILDVQEAETRNIVVPGQRKQIIRETLSCKIPNRKRKGWWSGSSGTVPA
jgi:hypothetical protein